MALHARYHHLARTLLEVDPAEGRGPGLAYGRGGMAYALWRVATATGDTRALERAREWLRRGIAAAARLTRQDWPRFSFSRGLGGLYSLQRSIAATRGDAAAERRSLQSFLHSFDAKGRCFDLLDGLAGQLAGLAIVHRATLDRRVEQRGAAVASEILGQWRRWFACGPPASIAHGPGGVLLATLEWRSRGQDLDDRRVIALLDELAPRIQDGHDASWCQGSSGHAVLWTSAYEAFGEARYLLRARRAGEHAFRHVPRVRTLCCGSVGVAYALLALDRIDTGRWRDRAVQAALAPTERPASQYPHGVLLGDPGYMCLLQDLVAPRPGGFPLIQA